VNLLPAKMLLIYLDETDRHGDIPLYEAVVRKLSHLEVKGATVHAGIMSFGRHHRIHHKRLLGFSDDRPIMITVVDTEEKISAVLPEIRPLVREGLIVLVDVEVVE
jgi:uncharacterized protein